jgi:hypothetical protein
MPRLTPFSNYKPKINFTYPLRKDKPADKVKATPAQQAKKPTNKG